MARHSTDNYTRNYTVVHTCAATMKCVSSLCLLLILHASAYHLEPERLDHFIKDVAPGRRVDIVFVIDQLTHTDKERFYSEGRRLVEALLRQYVAIHKYDAHVAVITFAAGGSRVLLDYIKDDDITITKCGFFGGKSPPWKRVDYISDLESASGKALAGPLRLARYILYIGRLRRSSVKQIILLLTDGNITDSEEATKEAKMLSDDDAVAVYTGGTGSPSWHDARVRVLASRDGSYGSYEDWRDMLTTNLTSYTSGELAQMYYIVFIVLLCCLISTLLVGVTSDVPVGLVLRLTCVSSWCYV